MRDIGTKVNGTTTLDAGDFNALNDEIENFVESADLTLDPAGGPDTDLFMLSKAIAAYANAGNAYQDSGAANAYVLSLTTNLLEVDTYYDNMVVIFKAGNANTGASTINVNGLGLKDLETNAGAALPSGIIPTDGYVLAIYNLSDDRFEIMQVVPQDHTHSGDGDGGSAIVSATLTNCIAFTETGTPDKDVISEQGQAKGWAIFEGTAAGVMKDSYNVTGFVRDATGTYTVTWDRDFSTAFYCCQATSDRGASVADIISISAQTAGSVQVLTQNNAGVGLDAEYVHVIAYGTQVA